MGLFDPDSKIYDIDPDLLYYRTKDQPKKEYLHFEKEKWHNEQFVGSLGGVGSNCWVVGGNFTKSGKPILSCDPHLNKQMQSMWYMMSLRWGDGKYIVGGSTVGLPIFSYGRSNHLAFGGTALNPDNTDLYVEQIEGDKYLFDGEWHDLTKIKETIKVRFSSDINVEFKQTRNGMILYKPDKDEMGFSVMFPLEFMN